MEKRSTGTLAIFTLGALNIILWLVFTPPNDGRPFFINQVAGEMLSTTALILMACNLFLAARPRLLEPYFGGLDQMYQAHKKTAIFAMIFLFAHFLVIPAQNNINLGGDLGITALVGIVILVLLALTTRIPFVGGYIKLRYDQWRLTHRFIGLFFITGIIHSLIVPAVIVGSPIVSLYVYTIAYSAVAAYVYKELLEGMLRKKHTYIVEEVRKLNRSVVEITLKPQQSRLRHRAGQFLYISFSGDKLLAEAHPFTISSSPNAENVRLAVRAVGDFTQYLYAHLRTGMLAKLEGGYGMFEYKRGGQQQVWVAGGIGITPFLSWIRDFGSQLEQAIDFFYTVREPEEVLYLEEINEAAARYPNFRLHLIYSNKDGRLSAENIVASSGTVEHKEIYLCGPLALIESLRKQFIELGVPARRIHFEEFNFR